MAEPRAVTAQRRRRPPGPGARLEEDTVVAVLNTIHEIVSDSLDNARSLLQVTARLAALGAQVGAAGGAEQGLLGRGLGWVEPRVGGVGARRWVGGACGAEPMVAK